MVDVSKQLQHFYEPLRYRTWSDPLILNEEAGCPTYRRRSKAARRLLPSQRRHDPSDRLGL